MSRRIPPDAFDIYYAMGATRGYKGLAQRFGVSKRSIVKVATREKWQERITELERKARERSDNKLLESIEAMHTRHIKTLQAVHARALEALRSMPLESAMQAVRAIEIVIREERVARGEPSDRQAVNVAELIKNEYERVMVADDEDDTDEENDGGEAQEGDEAHDDQGEGRREQAAVS